MDIDNLKMKLLDLYDAIPRAVKYIAVFALGLIIGGY